MSKSVIIIGAGVVGLACGRELSKKGYEPQFGARPIKRLMQKEILNGLSKELLEGKIKEGDIILIDSFDDNIVFRKNDNKEINLKIDEKVNI